MNLTSVDSIKKLMSDSNKLGKAIENYNKTTEPSNVDKYGFKFREGTSDRFRCFQLSVYLEAYYGNYGSSSCYTLFSLDSGKVNEVFAEYLEDNKEEILQELSKRLKIKAQSLVDEAEKEVKAIQNSLEEVKGLK